MNDRVMNELTVDELSSIAGCGVVGAWMLFPDDENQRLRTMKHFMVKDRMMRLDAASPRGVVASLSVQVLGELVYTALDALSEADIANIAAKRQPLGAGAGMIVYNAIPSILRGESEPLSTATNAVGGALFRSRAHNKSKHVNEVVWRRFKPVAALWAAWVYRDDGNDGEAPFPCAPSDLPEFLSLAEGYRSLAEQTVAPRRREPVLARGVSVGIPEDVRARLRGGALEVFRRKSE